MPPFEPGNTAAAGFGRPRDLSREVARLREAAKHVDYLSQHAGLLLHLADQQDAAGTKAPWAEPHRERADALLAEIRVARERLGADVAVLLTLAQEARELAPSTKALRKLRRRAGRDACAVVDANLEGTRIHENEWAMRVASAAAALDRLTSEEAPQ